MKEKTNWRKIAGYWHRYAVILSKAMKNDHDFIEFVINNDEGLMDIIDEQRKEIDKLKEG